MRYAILFFLFLLLFVASCAPDPVDREEATALLQRGRDLRCEREALRRQLDQLWDEVADSLDGQLPAGMEAEERRNIIDIRNADLIRMFEVYPTLDSSLHRLVDRAEVADQQLAAQIRQLEEKQSEYDRAVQAFLMPLEKAGQQLYVQWRDSLAGIASQPCANPPIID